MSDTPIKLEPGRRALRKPELGSFMIVEVEQIWDEGDAARFDAAEQEWLVSDFLPVLRSGDVVLAGSLLYVIPDGSTYSNQVDWPMRPGAIANWLRYALLRYGPEEDA